MKFEKSTAHRPSASQRPERRLTDAIRIRIIKITINSTPVIKSIKHPNGARRTVNGTRGGGRYQPSSISCVLTPTAAAPRAAGRTRCPAPRALLAVPYGTVRRAARRRARLACMCMSRRDANAWSVLRTRPPLTRPHITRQVCHPCILEPIIYVTLSVTMYNASLPTVHTTRRSVRAPRRKQSATGVLPAAQNAKAHKTAMLMRTARKTWAPKWATRRPACPDARRAMPAPSPRMS